MRKEVGGLTSLSAAPSPLSYANADLPRKGGLAPVGSGPSGRPRNVLWFLFVSIGWLVLNVLTVASFRYDLNRYDPNFARPLLLALAWFLTGIGVLICWLMLVYAAHKDVRNLTDGGYDISPGKAVGFSFIPGFSAFWIVYMPARLAGEVKRHLAATGSGASAGSIVALQVASIPLGLVVPAMAPILYSISIFRIQRGLNEIWKGSELAAHVAASPAPTALIADPS